MNKPLLTAAASLVLALSNVVSVSAQDMFVSDVENIGAECEVSHGDLLTVSSSALPDPFAMNDGTRISTKEEWACRRNEIKKDLEFYEIGPKPDPETSTVTASVSGNTLTVTVTTKDGSINLTSNMSGSDECIAIGMNGQAYNISGCRQIPFNADEVVTYDMTGTQNMNDPFYKVYPDLKGNIGNYAAWSWGVSRLIDGIELVKDQLGVDMTKIGVQGCSYAGKMALFAAALDERIALAVVQESGGGGINSWRMSEIFTNRTKVSIEKIDNTSGSWFKNSMKRLDPNKLPHDHHELIAMIAPRAIIILGNDDWDWLGDESGYKSAVAAKKVFEALGVPDNIGWNFTGSHGHCSAPTSQVTSVNTFVNKFLKGQNVSTTIAIDPRTNVSFNGTPVTYDLSVGTSIIPWSTPTLSGSYGTVGPAPSGFTLTANVSPMSSVGPVIFDPERPANGRYEEGAAVTVTADPAEGWKFVGWEGGLTSANISETITMDASKTVTAKFAPTADGTENLVKNGDFSNTQNWALNEWQNSGGTFAVSGGTASITDITRPTGTGAAYHSLQLVQSGIPLVQGMSYRLTFEARAAAERDMSVYLELADDPYTKYLIDTVNLSSSSSPYTLEFTMTEPTDNNARIAFNFGGSDEDVTIGSVKLIYTASGGNSSICMRNSRLSSNRKAAGLRVTSISKSALRIDFGASGNTATINLYSLKGNVVARANVRTLNARGSHTFDVSKLPRGTYMIEVKNSGMIQRTRVMLSK